MVISLVCGMPEIVLELCRYQDTIGVVQILFFRLQEVIWRPFLNQYIDIIDGNHVPFGSNFCSSSFTCFCGSALCPDLYTKTFILMLIGLTNLIFV